MRQALNLEVPRSNRGGGANFFKKEKTKMMQPGFIGNVLFWSGAIVFIIGAYIPGVVIAGLGIYICLTNE